MPEIKINAKIINGYTPLLCAIENRYTEVTKLLIAHGANLTLKNTAGENALALAQRKENTEIEQVIITAQNQKTQ